MKAIMLSIQPKWMAKILNCEKTIEIRKKFPKDYVGWVYIYCTKEKDILCRYYDGHWFTTRDRNNNWKRYLNGKVVARFWCDKVEEIDSVYDMFGDDYYFTETTNQDNLLNKSCLTFIELDKYLEKEKGYAIHISQLEIFDKPKELSEFYKTRCKNVDENNDCLYCNNNRHCPFAEIDYNPDDSINAYICGEPKKPLTRAPQSWQFIEVEDV